MSSLAIAFFHLIEVGGRGRQRPSLLLRQFLLLRLPLLGAVGKVDPDAATAEVATTYVASHRRHPALTAVDLKLQISLHLFGETGAAAAKSQHRAGSPLPEMFTLYM